MASHMAAAWPLEGLNRTLEHGADKTWPYKSDTVRVVMVKSHKWPTAERCKARQPAVALRPPHQSHQTQRSPSCCAPSPGSAVRSLPSAAAALQAACRMWQGTEHAISATTLLAQVHSSWWPSGAHLGRQLGAVCDAMAQAPAEGAPLLPALARQLLHVRHGVVQRLRANLGASAPDRVRSGAGS